MEVIKLAENITTHFIIIILKILFIHMREKEKAKEKQASRQAQ